MPPTRTVTILDTPSSPSSSVSPSSPSSSSSPYTRSLTQRPKRKLKIKEKPKKRLVRESTKATSASFFADPRYTEPGSLHIKYEAQNIVEVQGKKIVWVPKGRSVVQHLPRHRRLVLSEENMMAFCASEDEVDCDGKVYVGIGDGMFVPYGVVSQHEESWKRHWGYFESELYQDSQSSQESQSQEEKNEEQDVVLTIPPHTRVVVVVKAKAKVVRVTPDSLLLLRSVEEVNREALRRAEGGESEVETEVDTEVEDEGEASQ